MEYSITSGEENIGNVQVERQGLYYRISCRCKLTGCVRYNLLVVSGENTVDLGLCVPKDGVFGVDTSIPIKRVGEGTLTFYVRPRHSAIQGKFLRVSPDEPFAYIRRLQQAHLERVGDSIGIILPETQSTRDKPTGQWSEPITSE